MPVKLAIFDLDMTLVNSMDDIAAAAARTMNLLCGFNLSIDDVIPFIGPGLRDMFKNLAPDADDEKIGACVREYRRWYYDHCADRSYPYEGVREGLALLRSADCRLAVATAKNAFMAYRLMGKLNLTEEFDMVRGADGLKPKPDPEIVIEVCARMNVEPNASIMIGDSTTDILAGKSAGTKTLAVTYGVSGKEKLERLKPDFLSPDFKTVVSVLLELT